VTYLALEGYVVDEMVGSVTLSHDVYTHTLI
jgi:hypothetical protein